MISGRKTFFITPDTSLLPESYLENYLALGFECYFVNNDLLLPLEEKLRIILSIFTDSIMIFNTDANIPNVEWTTLIANLQKDFPNDIFAVTYSKRQSPQERLFLEKHFLYTVGIKGGCIQLEYQKKNNYGLIESALYANQAMGRRKRVRVICTKNCIIQFNHKNKEIHTSLKDISLSHFTIVLPQFEIEIEPYEKITNITCFVNGFRFFTDAVLFMKRPIEHGEVLYVFSFVTKQGTNGLDELTKQTLLQKLYSILQKNCTEILDKLFNTAIANKRKNKKYSQEKKE